MIEPNNPKFVMLVTSTSPEATTTTSTSPEATTTIPPTTISPAECLALNNILLYLKKVNGDGGKNNNTGVMPYLTDIYDSVNDARDTASKISQEKNGEKKYPDATKQKRNDYINKALEKIPPALEVVNDASTKFTAFAETFCDTSPQPSSCSLVLTTITQLTDVKNNLNTVVNTLNDIKTQGPGKLDPEEKYHLWGSERLKNQSKIINNQRENTKTNWQNIQQFMKDNGCKVNK